MVDMKLPVECKMVLFSRRLYQFVGHKTLSCHSVSSLVEFSSN